MTDRRMFIKTAGFALAGGVLASAGTAEASEADPAAEDALGVLVDTTLCIGCRKCELACDRKNRLTSRPESFFEDTSALNSKRTLSTTSYTIVNKYREEWAAKPTFIKTQCMHCNKPSCVSACIVGALKKAPSGAVTYDYGKCIGCRYCMVACPFQVPTYEFEENLHPRVMKCNFCFDLIAESKGAPACVDACPVSCLVFGRRSKLLKFGHKWIDANPGRYVDHIYGEKEVGGTSWMYLAGMDFHDLGLPRLGEKAPPVLSEEIQHSVFKHWIPPVSLYAILSGAMWLFRRREELAAGPGVSGAPAKDGGGK